MEGSLGRLLRLRTLLEEQAGMEFEAETARLRQIEGDAMLAGIEARSSRERWFRAVEGGAWQESVPSDVGWKIALRQGPAGVEERMAEESAWEMAMWRGARAESRRSGQEAAVLRARNGLLDSRRERMQVETLVVSDAVQKRASGERRAQFDLDDWHQSRRRLAAKRRRSWVGIDPF